MIKHKISALRRAILLTMTKAEMQNSKIKKMQKKLNECLAGGIEADFKKAVALGHDLPRHLHKDIIGRYAANIQNMAD